MLSMKQTDKKRTPTNNETKRSARIVSRENKLQQEKPTKTLKAKEADKKASSARVNSSIVVSDTKKSAKPSEVYEKLVEAASRISKSLQETNQESRYRYNKPSTDLNKEPNDGREESDSETMTDSVSCSGDSRATEDDLHNLQINTSSDISNKTKRYTKESLSNIAQYSVGNNSKGMKVHPKPSSTPSSISSEGVDDQDSGEPKEVDILDEASNGIQSVGSDDGTLHTEENTEHKAKEALDRKITQMEMRIEKLEGELSEVAAFEISLYSVVQEHCSSAHKVHTPAQRLSRLYNHASKHLSEGKRASIARNTVSALGLISKSCGNDVPRLTFWWSNIIVLREIVTQAFGSSCQLSSSTTVSNKLDFMEFDDEWQETRTFTSELEKVESGIFSRIVESIWWQTLMPNMQSLAAERNMKETTGKLLGPTFSGQQQSNFSINVWQNTFHDAFKRLCPVRAGGHECGCLPVLARMVMEQCVARLDVAMFNAILHEPAHEIPTGPVSDMIPASGVLPIPAGDLSFGSGAQLKKAVGNWSRWLTDKFSMDTDDDDELGKTRTDELKCFHLLDSLSGLLMVPKDMLLDRSIRAEVCPSISLALLTRILSNFTPDEFCPDPVPNTVLEALDAESMIEHRSSEDNFSSFPYAAATIIYNKPPFSIEKVSGLSRRESMIQTKEYTSDEEVEEYIIKNLRAVKGNARYDLLREVWSS
ncbi:hypothetical protein L6452_03760 [Arctium lappa]|uniref:Uncharacterized protein n=1 Tax=Arctium lappa TaxID=4217 RepID=A0ACB9FPC3_ARCLA|nr:hypothetical protein L6452_03760 [Arctium lappa]